MIYADFHIHVGRSLNGKPVKITAAKTLTLPKILDSASNVKGLSMVGIIDAHSYGVRDDFRRLLFDSALKPLSGGGYRSGTLTVIPGTEVELKVGSGTAHFLAYFPSIEDLERYIEQIQYSVKNWQLGSQTAHLAMDDWLEAVDKGLGIWMPAHVFTPHKGIYGNCCNRLTNCLCELPQAIELGLSADSSMALTISELDPMILLSNSDAHSLANIAREFNLLNLSESSFTGFKNLIERKQGSVVRNYGLSPTMGKYHRSFCLDCQRILEVDDPVSSCPLCHSTRVIPGVYDRIALIGDRKAINNSTYTYQVPLLSLPGVGPKTYKKLLQAFHTEIAVLHEAPIERISNVVGDNIAYLISQMRNGNLKFVAGGGGLFGKIIYN